MFGRKMPSLCISRNIFLLNAEWPHFPLKPNLHAETCSSCIPWMICSRHIHFKLLSHYSRINISLTELFFCFFCYFFQNKRLEEDRSLATDLSNCKSKFHYLTRFCSFKHHPRYLQMFFVRFKPKTLFWHALNLSTVKPQQVLFVFQKLFFFSA